MSPWHLPAPLPVSVDGFLSMWLMMCVGWWCVRCLWCFCLSACRVIYKVSRCGGIFTSYTPVVCAWLAGLQGNTSKRKVVGAVYYCLLSKHPVNIFICLVWSVQQSKRYRFCVRGVMLSMHVSTSGPYRCWNISASDSHTPNSSHMTSECFQVAFTSALNHVQRKPSHRFLSLEYT